MYHYFARFITVVMMYAGVVHKLIPRNFNFYGTHIQDTPHRRCKSTNQTP